MAKEVDVYFGCYRGRVEELLTNGYCRISVPGILYPLTEDGRTLNIAALPPAECATSIDCSNNGNGTYVYPKIGDTVWCFFENGDATRPIYFATSVTSNPNWLSVGSISESASPPTENCKLQKVFGHTKQMKFGRTTIIQDLDHIRLQIDSPTEEYDPATDSIKPIAPENVKPGFAAEVVIGSADGNILIKTNKSVIIDGANARINVKDNGLTSVVAGTVDVLAYKSIDMMASESISLNAPLINITATKQLITADGNPELTDEQKEAIEFWNRPENASSDEVNWVAPTDTSYSTVNSTTSPTTMTTSTTEENKTLGVDDLELDLGE